MTTNPRTTPKSVAPTHNVLDEQWAPSNYPSPGGGQSSIFHGFYRVKGRTVRVRLNWDHAYDHQCLARVEERTDGGAWAELAVLLPGRRAIGGSKRSDLAVAHRDRDELLRIAALVLG